MLPMVDVNDGLRKTYLRRTQRISRMGERLEATKDAFPQSFISVSSA